MVRKSKAFVTQKHLHDGKAQLRFLADAFETGDPDVIAHAVGMVVAIRGRTDIADFSGLGRVTVYRALKPGGNPTLRTLIALLNTMNIKLTVKT